MAERADSRKALQFFCTLTMCLPHLYLHFESNSMKLSNQLNALNDEEQRLMSQVFGVHGTIEDKQ